MSWKNGEAFPLTMSFGIEPFLLKHSLICISCWHCSIMANNTKRESFLKSGILSQCVAARFCAKCDHTITTHIQKSAFSMRLHHWFSHSPPHCFLSRNPLFKIGLPYAFLHSFLRGPKRIFVHFQIKCQDCQLAGFIYQRFSVFIAIRLQVKIWLNMCKASESQSKSSPLVPVVTSWQKIY